MLVTEKPGRLRVWSKGKLPEPVQGVPEVVYHGKDDQGGLLDVEADPDFAQNGFIYLSFVGALVYSGTQFAGWRGSFLVGGLSSKAIIWMQMPDGSLLAIVDDKSGDLLRVTTVTGPRSRG